MPDPEEEQGDAEDVPRRTSRRWRRASGDAPRPRPRAARRAARRRARAGRRSRATTARRPAGQRGREPRRTPSGRLRPEAAAACSRGSGRPPGAGPSCSGPAGSSGTTNERRPPLSSLPSGTSSTGACNGGGLNFLAASSGTRKTSTERTCRSAKPTSTVSPGLAVCGSNARTKCADAGAGRRSAASDTATAASVFTFSSRVALTNGDIEAEGRQRMHQSVRDAMTSSPKTISRAQLHRRPRGS